MVKSREESGQEQDCGPCLCLLSPTREYVHLCICFITHLPILCAHLCSFLFSVDPKIFPGKKPRRMKGGREEKEKTGRLGGDGGMVVGAEGAAGSGLRLRPSALTACLASVPQCSALGRAVVGGTVKAARAGSRHLRGGGADEAV